MGEDAAREEANELSEMTDLADALNRARLEELKRLRDKRLAHVVTIYCDQRIAELEARLKK